MCTDRSVDPKTKEVLIKWVGDFLWHFEGAISGEGLEQLPDNPAAIIVDTILQAQIGGKDSGNKEQFQSTCAASYFQIAEICQE